MSIVLDRIQYIYMPGTPFQQTALEDVSLTIEPGEFIGIIGHTGSGKSTLVQHINGLLKPTQGTVTIDGIALHGKQAAAKEARRQVGMVFQYPEHQLFEESIYEDIAFGPRNLGVPEEEIDRRVRSAMAFVGLDFQTFAKRSPFHLSGGQMRRVAIAGVIALEPQYLILDEPSAGLDPRGREEIFGEIMELHQKTGMAVILVSHNMEDIARMATRLIVMNKGRIAVDGLPARIFAEQGELLQAAGVDVPALTACLHKLRAAGLPVATDAVTAAEAAAAIDAALRGNASC